MRKKTKRIINERMVLFCKMNLEVQQDFENFKGNS